MILAHHGADNGFTTKKFLRHIDPTVATCSSSYENHCYPPRQDFSDLQHEYGIRLMTTKTGDVIVKSVENHTGVYDVVNLKAKSTEVSSTARFVSI